MFNSNFGFIFDHYVKPIYTTQSDMQHYFNSGYISTPCVDNKFIVTDAVINRCLEEMGKIEWIEVFINKYATLFPEQCYTQAYKAITYIVMKQVKNFLLHNYFRYTDKLFHFENEVDFMIIQDEMLKTYSTDVVPASSPYEIQIEQNYLNHAVNYDFNRSDYLKKLKTQFINNCKQIKPYLAEQIRDYFESTNVTLAYMMFNQFTLLNESLDQFESPVDTMFKIWQDRVKPTFKEWDQELVECIKLIWN